MANMIPVPPSSATSCDVVNLCFVGDEVRQQPVLGGILAEAGGVMTLNILERSGLAVGDHQRPGRVVVAVGPKFLDYPGPRLGDPLGPELGRDVIGGHSEV